MESEPVLYIVGSNGPNLAELEQLFTSVHMQVCCYTSGLDFINQCSFDRPGCILMEVMLAGLSGLEVQERLAARGLTHPIIFLTSCDEIEVAVRAMKNGAFDYVRKPFSRTLLIDRINQAVELHQRQWAGQSRLKTLHDRMTTLSTREREVMSLVVTGKATKQIAAELGLSSKTVENHRSRIMEKMGVSGAVELVHAVLCLQASRGTTPVRQVRELSMAV